MAWLTLNLELVTPCFIGGASGSGMTAEDLREEGLRTPSLVGQWRFWLRALLGARADDFRRYEALLFGSQSGTGNQGLIWVRPVETGKTITVVEKHRKIAELVGGSRYPTFEEGGKPIDPVFYLLGQGLINFKEGLQRPALAAGQTFSVDVHIRSKPETPVAGIWRDLRQALWLWQTFGGLGARSRRGWGNVRISGLQGVDAIADEAERGRWQRWFPTQPQPWDGGTRILARLLALSRGQDDEGDPSNEGVGTGHAATHASADPEDLHSVLREGETRFSSLGCCCAVIGQKPYGSWPEALAEMGLAMLGVRSNVHGRPRPSEEVRVRDHDAVYALLATQQQPSTAPYRSAFGLPHNYFFKQLTPNKAEFQVDEARATRRASPVLLHVNKFSGGYAATVLWLKARLTNDEKIIAAKVMHGAVKPPDWTAVVEFLRCLRGLPPLTVPPGGTQPGPPVSTKALPAATSKAKVIQKGQEPRGTLHRREGQWTVVFEGDQRPTTLLNPASIPADTPDGAMATFFIQEANKRGIMVRFQRR